MQSAKRAFFLSMIGQPLNVVLLLTFTIASTRLLTPSERGVFSGVMSAFSLIQILQTFGTGVQLIRRNVTEEEIKQSAFVVWIGCIAAFILLQVFAAPISLFLSEPRAESVIRVLCFSCLAAPFEVLFGGQLLREMRGKEVVICMILKTIAMVSVSLVGIILGYAYMGMAFGFVASTYTYAIASFLFLRSAKTWRGFQIPTWAHLKGGASLTGFLISKNASERLIHPAVLALQGAYAAGILGTAWGILDMAKQVLVDTLMIFVTPLLSGFSQDPKSLRFYFEKMTAAMGGIVPPAFLSAAILSEEFIGFLFGEKWLSAAPIMSIFSLAGALHYSVIGYADVFIAQKKDSSALKFEIVMGTFCLAMFVSALTISLTAAAWTRVLYSGCLVLISIYVTWKTTGIDLIAFLKTYGKNVVVCLFTVFPLLCLHYLPMDGAIRLILGILSGTVCYILGLYATKHLLSHEVTRLALMVLTKLKKIRHK
jgi:O-antigen/teichoic acid export membrane protein